MSGTASFEILLPDIVQQAPHCPEIVALHQLRLATIDLCQETLWWKHTGDPIDVAAHEAVYDVEVPSQTEALTVTAAWFEGRQLAALGHAARFTWAHRNPDTLLGPPQQYTCPSPGQIQLTPIPADDSAASLIVQVAVCPTRTAMVCDRDLLSRWSDALINGALSRVYLIPNQPFTNLDQSKARYALYRQEVTQAKILANKAGTLGSLSVKPRKP